MSVPLDRLYNFLHGVCDRDMIIYRFLPHGSKKISDLTPLDTTPLDFSPWSIRHAICYDQEPLDFDAYNTLETVNEFMAANTNLLKHRDINKLANFYKKLNLRMVLSPAFYSNAPVLLVHSEKNSSNLKRYEQLGMIGVYWWCHAVIARDWFRHAEYDPTLERRKPDVDFLIYNRAWAGTREYRLKFAELLVENRLIDNCRIKFNPHDNGNHYREHKFKNKDFSITNTALENIFELNTVSASASADYVSEDYCATQMEVVLETLFDDARIQLTEKILRPIACGQPFMLVSTPGCLEYLRSYGFETFGQCIDESYDSIQDPLQRLNAIITEMGRITVLPKDEKNKLFSQLKAIADRNKTLFFSKQWHDGIVQEFKDNVDSALEIKKTFIVDLSDLA